MARSAKRSSVRVPPEGFTLLRAPDNCTAASAGGVEYPVDEDGLIAVASADAGELLAHGFTLAPVADPGDA